MYIVLDTETTGTNSNIDRVTQLAFIVYDNLGRQIFKYNEYIKPDGWVIKDIDWYKANGYSDADAYEKGKFFTENNMSTEQCERLGVPLFKALRELQDNLKLVDLVVGHNIAFDKRMIKAEQNRVGITHWLLTKKDSFCTMTKSNKLVCATSKTGRRKMPNLKECGVHFKIELENENLHDALYDVELCNEVYRKIR